MSEELAQDLNRIAQNLENPDSEDESENDEFKDWEAVSSSNSGIFFKKRLASRKVEKSVAQVCDLSLNFKIMVTISKFTWRVKRRRKLLWIGLAFKLLYKN